MTSPARNHLTDLHRQLIEQVPAITYIAVRREDGPWYYVSPQIHSMLGFAPDEWMADPLLWRKQIHPDDLERVLAAEHTAIQGGERYRLEYRVRTRDGRDVWVRDEAICAVENGNPIMRGLLLDITRKRKKSCGEWSSACRRL